MFVQQFDGQTLQPATELVNLPPVEAARVINAEIVAGPGAQLLVEARGNGRAVEAMPSAKNALRLPEGLCSLPPKPIYARAPDAKAKAA